MTAPEQKLGPFEARTRDAVEPCVFAGEPVGGKFENLSFAPDGRSLAYAVGDGIWIMDVPDFSGGCGPLPTTNKLVIPGGRHPHWGPADVPPASGVRAQAASSPTAAAPTRRRAPRHRRCASP